MRIGIDVDDVLFPWFDKAHEACVKAGITNGVTPSQWECYVDYGCTLQEWLDVIAAVTRDGSLYSGEPYPGAVDAMRSLREAGHTLHIVTARGFLAHGDLIRQATIDWLAENEIPHDSLTFSKDKTLVRTDVFVDDSWKNVSELTSAGVTTYMVTQPHNLANEHPLRVANVAEFAAAVLCGVPA